MKTILFLVTLVAMACACRENSRDDSNAHDFSAARAAIQAWAPVCSGLPCSEEDNGEILTEGDTALFAGLVCASGDASVCALMPTLQGTTGQFWRGAGRVDGGESNPFSRDMAVGILAWLAKETDASLRTSVGTKWAAQINRDGKLCLNGDNRCDVTPLFKWTFNSVAEARGFDKLSVVAKEDPTEWPPTPMRPDGVIDDGTLLAEALVNEGYALHLVGVNVWIRRLIGQGSATLDQAAAQMHRRQPENCFYFWLAVGASDGVADCVATKLPAAEPARRYQWAWQRDDSERAWEETDGWSMLFMFNLLGAKP